MTAPTLADPAVRAALRLAVADVARSQIGQHESPPRSNRTQYGAWYGMNGSSWCAMFVSWCYDRAARQVGCENPLAGLQSDKGFARVTTTYPRAKRWGIVLGSDERIMVGDVMIWSKGLPSALVGANGHTGVVTATSATEATFEVVEGNTNGADSRTGGIVMAHRHFAADGRHGRLLAVYRPTRRFGGGPGR